MTPYYDDGVAVIYHADCRDLLGDLLADVVVTDPPYGINWAASGSIARGVPPIVGDHAPFDPAFLLHYRCVLFGANHYAHLLPPSRGWLIWDKITRNDVRWVLGDAEMAWTNCIPRIRVFRHLWAGYHRASESATAYHPTQKPVALMTWVLSLVSEPGEIVLDPFMGSGSALVAAKQLGRRAIGIEIEERYCEIAANRLRQEVLPLEVTA